MSIPSQRTALVRTAPNKITTEKIAMPELKDDYILVKTAAVSINPADYKGSTDIDFGGQEAIGAVQGNDYAGTVVAVGSKVTKPLRKGDRVAGAVHGNNQLYKEEGAYADYIVARGDLAIKIPDNLSFEEAATLGIGITTVGHGLYMTLKLPLPPNKIDTPKDILIYGASTTTGSLGVQFALLSGYRVIATSSPRHFDYLKSLGVAETFDYSSATCGEDIRAATNNALQLVWDCWSTRETAVICAKAMSDKGGDYASILKIDADVVPAVNPRIRSHFSFYYDHFGAPHAMADPYADKMVRRGITPPNREVYEFGKLFWELSRGLLAEGKVKVARPTINRNGSGLEGVLAGLKSMGKGEVSGEKLIYTL
ncbi:zinc-binding dehydrogenase [Trichoderma gracile]